MASRNPQETGNPTLAKALSKAAEGKTSTNFYMETAETTDLLGTFQIRGGQVPGDASESPLCNVPWSTTYGADSKKLKLATKTRARTSEMRMAFE